MAVRLPAAERRRQLLDVALEVFSRRGFHPTSMNDIAEAAGVTKPVLYQHFASKRDLYLELLDDVGGRLLEAVAKATASAAGPRQQVVNGLTAYFRFIASEPNAFTVLFGGGGRRDVEFSEAVARVEQTIADAVASLIDADIDAEHRRVLALGIVGMAETTGRHWIAGGAAGDPETLARRLADLAWAGLRGIRPVADGGP
jgi:AcrR family transcriptional regulator